MSTMNSIIAVYETHAQAEAAVKELQEDGVDMKSVSIAGKDTHTDEHVVGYYNAGDRMKYWGKMGALWGGFWGLLFGSAMFAIPGIGPILVAGPLVAWIIGALEGAVVVGGISAVGAGLYSIGVPRDSVIEYDTALKTDNIYLSYMAHPKLWSGQSASSLGQSTIRTPCMANWLLRKRAGEDLRHPCEVKG